MLKKELGNKYNPINLFLETCNYDFWFWNEESTDTTKNSSNEESADLYGTPPLKDDEVKEGTGLKIMIPNKLLNRIPISLAEIKTGNDLRKLKNLIRQILYLSFVSTQ